MAITINGSANTVAGVAAGGINDNVVDNGTMADDAIGVAELSATGTASSSTFLRGDNSWATPASGVTSDGNHNTLGGTNAGGNINTTVNSTAFGKDALATITGDGNSTAFGYKALEDCTGGDNTAIGAEAGLQLSTGSQNTFVGKSAGNASTTGTWNTAVGVQALEHAAGAAHYNVAIGSWSLEELTTGDYNIGIGHDAGHKQTTGEKNVWIGNEAGYGDGASDFSAYKNVGVGAHVLMKISGSWYNTGVGYSALKAITSGNGNTGLGGHAGLDVTTGGNNTLLGDSAGRSISPSGSITTGNNVICLGNNSVTDLYCADTSISSSDQRDKVDITDWTHGLDWINKLKPITYRWDKRSWYITQDEDGKDVWNTPDGSKKTARLHLGFKAQDVLAVEQADGFASKKDDMLLVNLNEDDTAYGMKYERLVVVLTKAVQELSAEVNTLKTKVAALEAG